MREIMLVLTQKCNLHCVYCYEQHSDQEMYWENIKQIIDSEYADKIDTERKVYFFGGEPFLAFNLIEQTVRYIESRYTSFRTTYSITSNGTLVHGDIQHFLKTYHHKTEFTLSLDGTQVMHDRNRKTYGENGSFSKIDIPFFQEYFPHCTAKMTISQYTFPNFAEGIIYLESLGFRCKANFASGVDLQLEENYTVLWRELNQLISYYSAFPDKPLCFMLDLNLSLIHAPINRQFRYCSAGVRRRCYCDGGNWYPCQGLMPMATNTNAFLGATFTEDSILESSPCKGCDFVRICQSCYAANFAQTGDIYSPGKQTCILNKACMAASARIQYNRLLQKPKESYTKEERLTIMAILKIAKELAPKI